MFYSFCPGRFFIGTKHEEVHQGGGVKGHRGRSGGANTQGSPLPSCAFIAIVIICTVREADRNLGRIPRFILNLEEDAEVKAIGVPQPAPYVQIED